jgi:CRISPR-associated protein Csm1
MDENVYKIAIAAFLHDIGKFAERAKMSVTMEYLNNNAGLYQPFHNNYYSHKHAVYTAAFIEEYGNLLPEEFNQRWGLDDPLINLAAGHHRPETPMQWIIAMSDRLSSGFDRREFDDHNKAVDVKDHVKTRMLPIFEGISLDENWKEDNPETYKYRYPLKELSPQNIFPVEKVKSEKLQIQDAASEYEELFNNFIVSLGRLIHKGNIPLWFEHFNSLYMVFTSQIPAATVGKIVPDVSLYDHSKMTSALASALYLFHSKSGSMKVDDIKDDKKKKFLIVAGDFYGIQNFIFSEGGNTNRAAAKLLRGRSFAVSLMLELAADMVCREIGLTPASIVLDAAGKFNIIAPNLPDSIRSIEQVEKAINKWLLDKYYGEVSVGISFVEASSSDFESRNFGNLWQKISGKLEEKKFRKINLEEYGGAINDYLGRFNNDLDKKLCPFCGKRPSDVSVEGDPLLGEVRSACGLCRDHIYLGTKLVKNPRIAVAGKNARFRGDKLREAVFGFYQVSLDVEGDLNDLTGDGNLLKYWDITVSRGGDISKEITAKFFNGYVPVFIKEDENDETVKRLIFGKRSEKVNNELFDMIREGSPKAFHHLAKMALIKKEGSSGFTGVEALGVLKADIDNLGLIFGCGQKYPNISRLANLSRQMNFFFTVYLPFVFKTESKFSDVYTVFAGGDDLFLIGPWNRVIELASFLEASLRKYVCDNGQITISAGISVCKPGEPVASISEEAEEALKKSKNNGRDSVTIFGEAVKWKDFGVMMKIKSTIEDWLKRGLINNAMLFKFNTFTYLAKQEKEILNSKEEIKTEDWEYLKWRSMFKYTLVRNIGKNLRG